MWIVEKKGKFIHGVFKTVTAVNKYLALTQKEGKNADQSTYMCPVEKYPLFIAEYTDGKNKAFEFSSTRAGLDKEMATKKVSTYQVLEIGKDYKTKISGTALTFKGKK